MPLCFFSEGWKQSRRFLSQMATCHVLIYFDEDFMYMFFVQKIFPTKFFDIWCLPSRDAAENVLSKWLQEDTRDGRDYILRVTGLGIGKICWIGWRAPITIGEDELTQFDVKRHFVCSKKLVKNHQAWWYVCYLCVFCWGEQSDICALCVIYWCILLHPGFLDVEYPSC